MLRSGIGLMLVLAMPSMVWACSFCGAGLTKQQTLREHYSTSKVVIFGTLKNPKPSPDNLGGSTEFHVREVMKSDSSVKLESVITIPRYLPVIGNTSPDFLFFFGLVDGKLEPSNGVVASSEVVQYLREIVKQDVKDARRLGFFFQHLDSPHETISTDAFVEFARANDSELTQVVPLFNRLKIRAWLANPDLPSERIGVYSLLLGLSGNADDASWFAGELQKKPRSESVNANLGGMLAGLILLDPAQGWKLAHDILSSADASFSEKLSVIGTLRYFQSTRGQEIREKILACSRLVIEKSELADLVIDDLRRCKWWDLTSLIFGQYGKPTFSSPAVKRGIVRYALQCPLPSAQDFLTRVRAQEPALVQQVEESLRLYETPKKP